MKSLARQHHAHGCAECHLRYTDACNIPDVDGRCQACRGSHRPLWSLNADPAECCLEHSRLVTKEEMARYALAGSHTWYRCSQCSRTHPYKPKEARNGRFTRAATR